MHIYRLSKAKTSLQSEDYPLDLATSAESEIQFLLQLTGYTPTASSDEQKSSPIDNFKFSYFPDSEVRLRSMSDPNANKPAEAIAAVKQTSISRVRSSSRPISIGSIKIRTRSTEDAGTDSPTLKSPEEGSYFTDQGSFNSKKSKGKQKGLSSLSALFSKSSRTMSMSSKATSNCKKTPVTEYGGDNSLFYPSIFRLYANINVTNGIRPEPLMISNRVNVKKVIKEAIERLKLDITNRKYYALCEIIYSAKDRKTSRRFSKGNSGSKSDQSQPLYLRVLDDYEQPLALQTFWQVAPEYERRFELLWKTDALAYLADFESSTGLENLRKRLVKSFSSHENVLEMVYPAQLSTQQQQDHAQHEQLQDEGIQSDRIKSDDETPTPPSRKLSKSSSQCPHFVMIRGFELKEDEYIYNILQRVILVCFRYSGDCTTENEILLRSPDILPQHCWIYNRSVNEDQHEISDDQDSDSSEAVTDVWLSPFEGALVTVNNVKIVAETKLTPGDLIGFGRYYLFIYKNPKKVSDSALQISWLNSIPAPAPTQSNPSSEIIPKVSIQTQTNFEDELDFDGSVFEKNEAYIPSFINQNEPSSPKDDNRLELEYGLEQENQLLSSINILADPAMTQTFKLAPAYVLAMSLEYSIKNHGKESTILFTDKIYQMLKNNNEEAITTLKSQLLPRGKDATEKLNAVLPTLSNLVLWIANTIEVLHFVNTHSLIKEVKSNDFHLLTNVSQQSLSQIVSIIIKILRKSISESANYSSEKNSLTGNVIDIFRNISFSSIATILNAVYDLSTLYDLHPEARNACLSNILEFLNYKILDITIKYGVSGNYDQSHGISLQQNLNNILNWTNQVDLNYLATDKMGSAIQVAHLLASIPQHLFQSSWEKLSSTYNKLTAPQLHWFMSKHQFNSYVIPPMLWLPPQHVSQEVLSTVQLVAPWQINEFFSLPAKDYIVNLDGDPPEGMLYQNIQILNNASRERRSSMDQSKFMDQIEKKISRKISIKCKSSITDALMKMCDNLTHTNSRRSSYEYDPEMFLEQVSYDGRKDCRNADMIKQTNKSTVLQNSNVIDGGSKVSKDCNDKRCEKIKSKYSRPEVTKSKKLTDSDGSTPKINSNRIQQWLKSDSTSLFANSTDIDDIIFAEIDESPIRDDKEIFVDCETNDISSAQSKHDLIVRDQLIEDREVTTVILHKRHGDLGLGLVDGTKSVFRKEGVFVAEVKPEGIASSGNRISSGDKIIAVNGISLSGVEYSRITGSVILKIV
ncbi:uncharacterized protein TRIADDRAFT_62142 [Trichoplax adhaerens]|uniref:Ras-associating and dilute domain-containing protein n=1 Tax=Trichoplax adhaerens TaxID=10228 RepID=B3SCY6_TRIAD|nr:predicted protein [Trichoplax adhaerens]EDV19425.1 predicted protein [Trichoplax adhaerens]|eukprot:XP_002118114.1 predicted protein [Trichoplax adhaerens]